MSALPNYYQCKVRRHFLNRLAPNKIAMINSARNTKNNTFAMEAAPSAIPPNPNMAAMIAITKKITDQRSITLYLLVVNERNSPAPLPAGTVHDVP